MFSVTFLVLITRVVTALICSPHSQARIEVCTDRTTLRTTELYIFIYLYYLNGPEFIHVWCAGEVCAVMPGRDKTDRGRPWTSAPAPGQGRPVEPQSPYNTFKPPIVFPSPPTASPQPSSPHPSSVPHHCSPTP